MRLLRGTGIQGLSGISPLRPIDTRGDVFLLRPMLDVGRADVEAYLESLGVTWVEDPSNRDPRFARVRMRRQILPACEEFQPGASLRIAALAEEARAIHEFVEAQFAESKKLIKTIVLGGGVKVERYGLGGLPRPLWCSVLRQAIRRVRGDLRRLDRAHLEPIAQLAQQCKSTGALALPGEAVVCLDRGDVYVFPGPLPPPPTGSGHPSPMGAGQWRLRFAALGALAEVTCARPDIVLDLEVRVRRPGDRLYGSNTKVKELLMKKKVPRPYRDFVPLLVYGDQVIAAPAILSSRMEELSVHWLLETTSPVLDLGMG
jgi:tRNA(Ile)-lysidine synthase